jgi:hypothetical protein
MSGQVVEPAPGAQAAGIGDAGLAGANDGSQVAPLSFLINSSTALFSAMD